MHPNPVFRKTETHKNIAFAQQRSFGILTVNHDDGPLVSHIPFSLSDDGLFVEAHLVRSNPILRLLDQPIKAVIAVSGADAYISPDWYDVDNQVPTWNYVAVHLRGALEKRDHEELPGVLDRLSALMEDRLHPKKPWVTSKMDVDIYEKMRRQIVPISMNISDIEGTWKLNQNKTPQARAGAIEGLNSSDIGLEIATLAQYMKDIPDE